MSATETQQLGFIEADVRKLPTLVCVGRVSAVGEGKVSKAGTYIVQPIELSGFGASPNVRYNLLYRPEWLVPGFNINELDGEDGKKMQSVFRRNIAVKSTAKGIAALKGLAGSDENYHALCSALLGANLDPESETIVDEVQQILTDFFTEHDEVEVGYVLQQRKDKTEELDGNGKNIYVLADGYDVKEFFIPTREALAAYQKRADKSKDGMFKVAYDGESF